MVGLSVILENYKDLSAKRSFQVVSKGSMIKSPSNPSSPTTLPSNGVFSRDLCAGFLDRCFLCHEKLMPSKDIYMYKGDRAFCSVECRCREILMDEEETGTSAAKTACTIEEYNHCSLAAAPSSSSSGSGGKGSRNRASNAFVC